MMIGSISLACAALFLLSISFFSEDQTTEFRCFSISMDVEILIDIETQNNSGNTITSMVSISKSIENKRAKSPENSIDKKKKGVFNSQWTLDVKFAPFLRECKSDSTKAACIACNDQFSIHHGGKNDIERHMKLKKHVNAMRSFSINRELITSTMRPIKDGEEIAAAEGCLVYHGVKHGHSYLSQQCTTNVIKTIFSSTSNIGKSISCARTKSSAIASNVLAPYFTEQVLVGVKEAYYYSIMFDASNKGNTKFFPVCVQYFSKFGVRKGIEYSILNSDSKICIVFFFPIGMIDLIEDADESALNVHENLKAAIQKSGLKLDGLTSIGADNTNVNMGNNHSVYSLFFAEIYNLIKGKLVEIMNDSARLYLDGFVQETAIVMFCTTA